MTMAATSASVTQSEDLIYQLAAPAEWGRAGRGPCFAARLSGLYTSRDAGQTWQSAYRSLGLSQDLPTLAVAVAPGAARGLTVFAGYNGGLLRSRDSGQTWENIAFLLPSPAIVALAVSPQFRRDSLVFAGTLEDGVYYSADGGEHWQTGNLGLIDVNVLCLGLSPGFAADQTMFAGTQSGLFASRNAGRAWREVDLPIEYDAVTSLALAPNFAADGILFAGTEAHGLLCSSDAGHHWQRLGQADLSNSIDQIVLGPDYPRLPQLLVRHDGRLSMSDDGGGTWQPWQAPAMNAEAATAVLAPRGFSSDEPMLVGLESGRFMRIQG
jgi:photosystem II stability/assembly factor-like uncharacterized protein